MFIIRAIYKGHEGFEEEQNYICDFYAVSRDKNGTKVTLEVQHLSEPLQLQMGINGGYIEFYIMNENGKTIDRIYNGGQN